MAITNNTVTINQDLKNPSQRQLKVRIRLGALNIVEYPDRLSTSSAGTQQQGLTNVNNNPSTNAVNTSSPSRIQSFGNGFILPPNPDINAPYNTFIYGALNNQPSFNLLAPPADSTMTAFPFASTYGNLLTAPLNQLSFTGASNSSVATNDSAPYVPSNTSGQSINTPKLTTYNMWAFVNSGSINTSVTYQRGNNPNYPSNWNYGTATQSTDSSNQAAILVNSTNNQLVSLRRMFNLRQDCLYDPEATIVYPSSSGISPTQYNQRSGTVVINPKENCGFMLSFDVQQFLGSSTQSSNLQGVTIKFGNLDLYAQASTSSNIIQYYELVLSNSATPVLRFYHPVEQSFSELTLQGSPLNLGINRIYIGFFGNILTVGFNENTYNWNTISSIEPNENESFTLLYHLIPGGRTNPQIDSSIQVDFSNIQTYFKYSGLAFKNIITSSAAPTTYDFFDVDNNSDPYKKTFSHQTSVSTTFLKKISQTTRLNDFFHAKGLRLYERINGTPQYVQKINSIYGFSSEVLSSTTEYNFSNITFARDWRMQDPYASDFNNCNPWEVKTTISNPNFDPVNSGDNALPTNMQLNIVFDSPVYSPIFLGLDTSTMPTSDISLTTSSTLSSEQTNSLNALQNTDTITLLVTNTASYNSALVNPVFYYQWGDITDFISNANISINHSVNTNTGVAQSNTTLTINNLAFSQRGSNILNYIENNLTVIEISACYEADDLNEFVYFEGVITTVNTVVSAVHSITTLTCSDWLTYVLNNTLAGTSIALQGTSIRSVINTGITLAALGNFTTFLNSSQGYLPETTTNSSYTGDPCTDADTSFITALNFIVGNASAQTAGITLTQQVQITDDLITVMTNTLPFIVNDLSIPVLYQNLRSEFAIQSTDGQTGVTTNQRSAVVIENRFLNNCSTTRNRDVFKFLVQPSQTTSNDNTQSDVGSLISNSLTDFGLSSSTSQFHGTIMSDITRVSQPQNLYEGVYLFAQGLGNVPLYEIRTSDSYSLNLPSSSSSDSSTSTDQWLYATALNRSITDSQNGGSINVLDQIDQTDYNNESNLVTAWTPGNTFTYGYVGFRKRLVDTNSTTIQTATDLKTRGDLYAQYIRKVVQTIQFQALVTQPLQHYNNFVINGLASASTDNIVDQDFSRLEYQNFLYNSVTYNINKAENYISATVIGATVPEIGSIYSNSTGNNQNNGGN